jgi:hypothetical protein
VYKNATKVKKREKIVICHPDLETKKHGVSEEEGIQSDNVPLV